MTTRKRIGSLILVAMAGGGFALFMLRTAEPSYQGKPLSRWIRGLEYENRNPTDEQRAAFHAMGEPAVTRLIAYQTQRSGSRREGRN